MKNKKSADIANRHFELDCEMKDDEVSLGLSATHEQVTDAYIMGDIQQGKNDAR